MLPQVLLLHLSALDTVETLVNDTDDGVAASASKISVLESTVNNPTTGLAATVANLTAVENAIDRLNHRSYCFCK